MENQENSFTNKVKELGGCISTVEMPTDEVDYVGREEIIRLLRATLDYTLPVDWDWSWETTSGRYKGNLTTRVKKFAYEFGRTNLAPEIISQVGNIGRSHSLNQAKYHVDFDNKIVWKIGAFGDYVSCFWNSRSFVISTLRKNAYAMRFWAESASAAFDLSLSGYSSREETSNPRRTYSPYFLDHMRIKRGMYGWGRCWIALDVPEPMSAIIFNSYPPGLQIMNAARVFAKLMGVKQYKRITLLNQGEWDRDLWINNGAGVLVSDNQEVLDHTHTHDLRWTTDIRERIDFDGDEVDNEQI